MGTTYVGEAECDNCGQHIGNIILTGAIQLAAGGGRWWECRAGQVCPGCGHQLTRLYEPIKLPETAQGK